MERHLDYTRSSFTLPLLLLRQLGMGMLVVLSVGIGPPARAQSTDAKSSVESDGVVELSELSIEELLDLEVTSVLQEEDTRGDPLVHATVDEPATK